VQHSASYCKAAKRSAAYISLMQPTLCVHSAVQCAEAP
jgi:hypothetical protein